MFRKVIVFTYSGYGPSKEKVQQFVGLFHQWGTEFVEFENGGVQYTVALVEKEDGSICTVMPSMIQFIKE